MIYVNLLLYIFCLINFYHKSKVVFESEDDDSASSGGRATTGGKGTLTKGGHGKGSSEMDKLKLCKDDFDESKMAFNSVISYT